MAINVRTNVALLLTEVHLSTKREGSGGSSLAWDMQRVILCLTCSSYWRT